MWHIKISELVHLDWRLWWHDCRVARHSWWSHRPKKIGNQHCKLCFVTQWQWLAQLVRKNTDLPLTRPSDFSSALVSGYKGPHNCKLWPQNWDRGRSASQLGALPFAIPDVELSTYVFSSSDFWTSLGTIDTIDYELHTVHTGSSKTTTHLFFSWEQFSRHWSPVPRWSSSQLKVQLTAPGGRNIQYRG